jgi:hypothetical protein
MEPQIERSQILDIIRNKVARIAQAQDPPRMIINLHGMFGIGKTSVLQQLFDYLRQEHLIISLNFDTEMQSSSKYACSWREVLGILQEASLLRHPPEYITFANGEAKQSVHDVSLVCQADIEQSGAALEEKKPVILLLDNLDDLPYWKWIQEHILKPILDQSTADRAVLIVATSQAPLFWHFWELREQCRPEELEPFSLEETRALLRLHDQEPWTELLYQVTAGYPLGLVKMLDFLAEAEVSTPSELSTSLLEEYRHTVLQQIIKQLPEKTKKNINIEGFLKSIVELGFNFDLTTLRHQSKLPPGRVNSTVALLNSRGFFAYNPTDHTYRLKPLIANLYPEAPRVAEHTDSTLRQKE